MIGPLREHWLISAQALGKAYTKGLNQFGVKAQKQSLICFENGFTQVYRPKKEFNKTILSIVKLITTQNKKIIQILSKHEAINKKIEEFALLKIPSSKKQIIKWLDQLNALLIEFYAYYIFTVFLLLAAEKTNITNNKINWIKQAQILRNKNYYFTIELLLEQYVNANGFTKNETCQLSLNELKNIVKINNTKKEKIINYFIDGKLIKLNKKEKLLVSNVFIIKKFNSNAIPHKNFIKGIVVFLGSVSGNARIIHSRKDYEKIAPNEIIVSVMTTPDIVPFLKKAVGIITDEGSLTCHASIIAREMKIPCLVGTKYATQFFCDGEKLLLDGLKSEAKKLKKSN